LSTFADPFYASGPFAGATEPLGTAGRASLDIRWIHSVELRGPSRREVLLARFLGGEISGHFVVEL